MAYQNLMINNHCLKTAYISNESYNRIYDKYTSRITESLESSDGKGIITRIWEFLKGIYDKIKSIIQSIFRKIRDFFSSKKVDEQLKTIATEDGIAKLPHIPKDKVLQIGHNKPPIGIEYKPEIMEVIEVIEGSESKEETTSETASETKKAKFIALNLDKIRHGRFPIGLYLSLLGIQKSKKATVTDLFTVAAAAISSALLTLKKSNQYIEDLISHLKVYNQLLSKHTDVNEFITELNEKWRNSPLLSVNVFSSIVEQGNATVHDDYIRQADRTVEHSMDFYDAVIKYEKSKPDGGRVDQINMYVVPEIYSTPISNSDGRLGAVNKVDASILDEHWKRVDTTALNRVNYILAEIDRSSLSKESKVIRSLKDDFSKESSKYESLIAVLGDEISNIAKYSSSELFKDLAAYRQSEPDNPDLKVYLHRIQKVQDLSTFFSGKTLIACFNSVPAVWQTFFRSLERL